MPKFGELTARQAATHRALIAMSLFPWILVFFVDSYYPASVTSSLVGLCAIICTIGVAYFISRLVPRPRNYMWFGLFAAALGASVTLVWIIPIFDLGIYYPYIRMASLLAFGISLSLFSIQLWAD